MSAEGRSAKTAVPRDADYAVSSMWASILSELPRRRPSFFLTGSLVPFLLWGLAVAIAHADARVLILSLIPTLVVVLLGFLSFVALRGWKKTRRKNAQHTRTVALVNIGYYSLMLLVSSLYLLWLAVEISLAEGSRPSAVATFLIVAYGGSIAAALLWSPRSLPRTRADDELGERRKTNWLPWVLGVQACAIGGAVFTGAWLRQDGSDLQTYLVFGLSALAALLLVVIAILGAYRLFVLSTRPVPAGLFESHGISA